MITAQDIVDMLEERHAHLVRIQGTNIPGSFQEQDITTRRLEVENVLRMIDTLTPKATSI